MIPTKRCVGILIDDDDACSDAIICVVDEGGTFVGLASLAEVLGHLFYQVFGAENIWKCRSFIQHKSSFWASQLMPNL